MNYRNLIVFFLAIFLSSCSYHEEYPTNWKNFSPDEGKECPNISGLFLNFGEDGSFDYKPNLAWLIFNDTAPTAEVTHISFSHSKQGELDIELFKNGMSIFRKILSIKDGDLSCESGFLKIEIKENLNQEGVIGTEWNIFTFAQVEENLIVKRENGAVGTMFLVPVVGVGTNWYKFQEISKEI